MVIATEYVPEDIIPLDQSHTDWTVINYRLVATVGDLNAINPDWSATGTPNRAGTDLSDYLETSPLVIINDPHQPTRNNEAGADKVIDLIIISAAVATFADFFVIEPLANSDHCMTLLSLRVRPDSHSRPHRTSFSWRNANWKRYSDQLRRSTPEANIHNDASPIQNFSTPIDGLEDIIRRASDRNVPKRNPPEAWGQIPAKP